MKRRAFFAMLAGLVAAPFLPKRNAASYPVTRYRFRPSLGCLGSDGLVGPVGPPGNPGPEGPRDWPGPAGPDDVWEPAAGSGTFLA